MASSERARARALFVAAIAMATASTAGSAAADPASAKQADKLFKQAADALAQKRYDEACPKLEESDRLERAVGTEYNLAVCYELSHRPASARRKYTEVVLFARQSGKESTAKEAADRAKKLDLVVPRLMLRAPSNKPAHASVRCDDQALDADAWQRPVELDPGAHRVVVTADGFATFDKVVTLAESETKDLQVLFTPLPGAGASPSPSPSSGPRALEPATPPAGAADRAPAREGAFPWRWTGLGVAAVGVVGLGVGGYLALHAKGASDDSGCSDGRSCPDDAAAERLRSAKSQADLATVFFVAGGALAAAGVVMIIVAPSPAPASAPLARGLEVKVTGAAGQKLTGVLVTGSW